jgi:putative ABC transport system permease protein
MSSSRSIAVLLGWLWQAQLRHQPGRLLLAVLSIGVGVALALAIHLVNRSALAEFAASIAQVNGEAQAQLIARADRFEESILARVASVSGIAVASPVIESEWRVLDAAGRDRTTAAAGAPPGDRSMLRVIGLDPLRAGAVTPALVPTLGETGSSLADALFAADAIFLSRGALARLGLAVGEPLRLLAADRPVTLIVRGTVEGIGNGQVLGVMDIGTMQWRLGELGRLSRIDLQFDGERDLASIRRDIEALLPAEVLWSGPQAAVQRMSNLSRAYRVNLNVLALVALFTGVFIVHAALALMVARQAGEQALLRVLGASTRLPAAWILGIAMLIGVLGAGLGVAGGIGLGHLMLRLTRGDLGGGYFSGAAVVLEIDPAAVLLALGGGLAAALAGAWGPVRAAARLRPAAALRGSGGEALLHRPDRTIISLALAGCALLLLAAPAIAGLPIAAYLAIALLLLAGILAGPRLLAPLARRLADAPQAARAGPLPWLALQRMAGTPGQTATAFAGVVASIALASAMAIMVTSFRTSVENWLDQVLPADLYGRAGSSRGAATLGAETQQAMAALPGAARTWFTRQLPLLLDPTQPAVTLIARDFGSDDPGQRLPMTGPVRAAPAGAAAAWITEAVVDLHGLRPGDWLELPIGPSAQALKVFVSGVWRDYSRQHGAIVIDREVYRRHTGDEQANEVAWWLEPGTDADRFLERLRELSPAAAALEFRDTLELKALSLRIFDRSFVVTYALEAIAIAVALFGAASSRAAEALARQKEFGMLRHLGLGRREVGIAFTLEAVFGALLSCLWGLMLGSMVAAILVHRINPQSFHWTMSMHWPVGLLAASLAATVLLAALAAAVVSRQAMGPGPLAAVRADW